MNEAAKCLITSAAIELEQAREAKGLSIRTVSERAEIAYGTYRTMEKGVGDPRISSLAQAAEAMGYTVKLYLAPNDL